MRRMAALAATFALGWLVAGCGGLSDGLPPEGQFRALHAVPTLDQVGFFARTVEVGAVDYAGDTPFLRVGEDTYPLSFQRLLPGDTRPTEVLSFDGTIAAEREYTFVLVGAPGALDVFTWTRAERIPDAAATMLAAGVGHAAPGFGALAVYIEAPGADLLAASPVATLVYGQHVAELEFPAGDYELTLTDPGDPGAVRFRSGPLALPAGTNLLFALLDGADVFASDLMLRVLGTPELSLFGDANVAPGLRFAHGARDTDPVDLVVDGDTANPVFAAVPFGTLTAYAPVPAGAADYRVDAADGSVDQLATATVPLVPASRNTQFVFGAPGSLNLASFADDRRRLAEYGRFRVLQAAASPAVVDVYLVTPGQAFTSFAPVLRGLGLGGDSGLARLLPGSYELVVAQSGTATALAGPTPVAIAAAGLYGVLVLDDGAGGATLELFDDFAP